MGDETGGRAVGSRRTGSSRAHAGKAGRAEKLAAPRVLEAARLAELPVGELRRVTRSAGREADTDPTLLGRYLDAVLAAARSGRRLLGRDVDELTAIGRRAADDGVPMGALVDLYLSATWRVWRAIVSRAPDGSPPGELAEAIMRGADDALAAVSKGYDAARRWALRREEALHRELVDDLLDGRTGVEGLEERADRFGFNLPGPHLVIVVRADRPLTDSGTIHAMVEAEVLRRHPGGDALVATREGLGVLILPGERIDPDVDPGRLLSSAGSGPLRVGVGRSHRGPLGVARSYREAREAIDLAMRLGLELEVADFEALLPYRMLARDHEALAELVENVLGPLQQARGGSGPLVETLEALFAENGNVTAAARRLGLTPRGVLHRMGRIERLSGYSPQDPEQRFVLELVVRGARLVDLAPSGR